MDNLPSSFRAIPCPAIHRNILCSFVARFICPFKITCCRRYKQRAIVISNFPDDCTFCIDGSIGINGKPSIYFNFPFQGNFHFLCFALLSVVQGFLNVPPRTGACKGLLVHTIFQHALCLLLVHFPSCTCLPCCKNGTAWKAS